MIAIFLADGFEEIEALTPVDILRRAGKEVCLVGVTGKVVTGSHGICVTADCEIGNMPNAEVEALVLPGGPGHEHLDKCDALKEMIRDEHKKGTLICAICAAPSILGKMGLLKGRKAICFPGYEPQLLGADVRMGAQVVEDGTFITARGAGAAAPFGFAIVSHFCGRAAALKLQESMCY